MRTERVAARREKQKNGFEVQDLRYRKNFKTLDLPLLGFSPSRFSIVHVQRTTKIPGGALYESTTV